MNTKYFIAFIATLLTALTAFGADKLCVIFPETTNLIFSVPIVGKTGERPYDAFLEYPSEYEDGRPTKFSRTGLGYFISIEVIEETEMGVQCKLKVDHHTLSDWHQYDIGNEIIVQQPVFAALATESDMMLPIGKWFALDCTGLKGTQPLSWQFKYQRDEESQQPLSPG